MSVVGTVTLMPPRDGLCQICASDHDPDQPHNAQSMYYQVSRQMLGLPCNWLTAMEHCSDQMKAVWTKALEERGVDVAGGGINPPKKATRARKPARAALADREVGNG